MRTLLLALLSSACSAAAPVAPQTPPPVREAAPPAPAQAAPAAERALPSFAASTIAVDRPDRRIVAIGDLHGDWASTRAALDLAGLVDENNAWTGGRTLMVQVGDQLDRGDQEIEIIENLERLAREAQEAGGAVFVLLGNHEIMNVAGDLRYATIAGFSAFDRYAGMLPNPEVVPERLRGRIAAFSPGGPFALRLADHRVILIIDGNVFVHGGVRPAHVQYGVDRINDETSRWIKGDAEKPKILDGDDSPVWSRRYSKDTSEADCRDLLDTLNLLGAKRMVVAHTPQLEGITSECAERVWRVDVGLADTYNGPTQVLEIVGEKVTVLR